MSPAAKRYIIQVISLMTAYVVMLFLSIWLLGRVSSIGWRIPIAVLPVVPLLFVVWAVIQFVRSMDELQKAIHFEAVTFSFLMTAVVTLTYGFLENAGFQRISVMYVPVLMCILWGVGSGLASRRYR
jgi:hypothetical protein